ncbi:MAG: adenosine kinase, partial [Acidobacteriota bacterium]|nr:adenosine kinase [Acidobacteriota bacterium]
MTLFPMKSKNKQPYVVGVGSALMDILLFESDQFVAEHGLIKGGMELVGPLRADELLAASPNGDKARRVPGGSSCNTTIGLGRLCGKAVFIGTRGDDELGRTLETAIAANNVKPLLQTSSIPTGRVLSVITPDAERTMLTYLGAASETSAAMISPDLFRGADLVHVEGYLLFNEPLIRAVFESAAAAGVPTSLDLASFTVVEAKLDLVRELVRKHVAVLLANEDEARSYSGVSDEKEALKILAQDAECAVVKVGKRGSYVCLNGETTVIEPVGSGAAVDTTGAGDLWASGFLYGLINGRPVADCGRIASCCGYEVCQVEGAHIPEEGWR